MKRNRVAFYGVPSHIPIFTPIQEKLEENIFSIVTTRVKELIVFRPNIIVLAHSLFADQLRSQFPESIIVWTRHGFAHKQVMRKGIGLVNFSCVSSQAVQEDLMNRGLSPRAGFWVTGFPLMDRVSEDLRAGVRPALPLGLDPKRKTVQ